MSTQNTHTKTPDGLVGSGALFGFRLLGPISVIGAIVWLFVYAFLNCEPSAVTQKRHDDYRRSKLHPDGHAPQWTAWGEVKTNASFGAFYAHQARQCTVCGFADMRGVR